MCAIAVKHVQACLCTKKDRESGLECCGGSVKIMQPCISVRKELEGSFNHYGDPVKVIKPVYGWERLDKAVLTAEQVMRSTCRPV